MNEGAEQPRIPGVRYRQVTRTRTETTVINGISSTREVPYEAWEPVPPREVDDLILRGVTVLTVLVTTVAVAGTTASVGGLLARMVAAPVAYAMGVVFTSTWVACLGVEWLHRISPERAKKARVGGRYALALSMAAVVAYGYTLNEPVAGAVGACIDLLSKGLWALVIDLHVVQLNAGVSQWVLDQEQKLAAGKLLGSRMARLDRRAAYERAVGGPAFHAATSILAAHPTTAEASGPRTDTGEGADTSPEPAPAPAPAGQPAAPNSPVSGHADPADNGVPDMSGHAEQGTTPAPTEITRPTIVGEVLKVLMDEPTVSDDDLTDRVRAALHDPQILRETVRRSRGRAADKLKKTRNAS